MLETTAEGGPLRLMENWLFGGSPGNYLVVRPRMPAPNTRAIGAFVRVEVGSLRLMRLITAGTSFMGQEPAEAFFGLNEATEVDSIIVEWPDGSQTTLRDIAANQVLTVTQATIPTLPGWAGALLAGALLALAACTPRMA